MGAPAPLEESPTHETLVTAPRRSVSSPARAPPHSGKVRRWYLFLLFIYASVITARFLKCCVGQEKLAMRLGRRVCRVEPHVGPFRSCDRSDMTPFTRSSHAAHVPLTCRVMPHASDDGVLGEVGEQVARPLFQEVAIGVIGELRSCPKFAQRPSKRYLE